MLGLCGCTEVYSSQERSQERPWTFWKKCIFPLKRKKQQWVTGWLSCVHVSTRTDSRQCWETWTRSINEDHVQRSLQKASTCHLSIINLPVIYHLERDNMYHLLLSTNPPIIYHCLPTVIHHCLSAYHRSWSCISYKECIIITATQIQGEGTGLAWN